MPSTCTIVSRPDGGLCGRPAVRTWTARISGATYHECAFHDGGPRPSSPAASADVRPGDVAEFAYAGVLRRGSVTRATASYLWADVVVYPGTAREALHLVRVARAAARIV